MIKYKLDYRTKPLITQRLKMAIKDHKGNFINNPSVRTNLAEQY